MKRKLLGYILLVYFIYVLLYVFNDFSLVDFSWQSKAAIACVYICAMTDLKTGFVYDVVVLIGALALGWNFLLGTDAACYKEFICFSFLQYLLFRKMYGEGDVMIFIVVGGILCILGKGIFEDLLLMLLTIFLVGIHQGIKGNIKQNGNLERPVPMVPYIGIALAFFL